MQKVTVQAPSNIAFIKYWGNQADNQPFNSSISMTLSACQTITTVKRDNSITADEISIQTKNESYETLVDQSIKGTKIIEQISRIKKLAKARDFVKIATKNTFPSKCGIASSASGLCALTAALLLAYDQKKIFGNKKELSKLVRLSGSASAARSVFGGFVELTLEKKQKDSYAVQIADEKHWDLVDIVAIITVQKKRTCSSEGHRLAITSPYFQTRILEMQPRIQDARRAIREKHISLLGTLSEQDTISMHMVMMTSQPPLYYWEPGTIAVMQEVMKIREQNNLPVYFSIDAGANVHVICEAQHAKLMEQKLHAIPFVQSTITNHPACGVHQITNHLI